MTKADVERAERTVRLQLVGSRNLAALDTASFTLAAEMTTAVEQVRKDVEARFDRESLEA
jgi:hypothetical protein